MELSALDVTVFVAFVLAVVTVGIGMSRRETDSEGYFLAGRGLTWWLIGFSLIAANISTEQFVGMSGSAANYLGLAIASYEWMAAITLVIVAFVFLPAFLSAGIYTIPEFLEYRYNNLARGIMSLLMVAVYVAVTFPAVVYSGALMADVLFHGQVIVGLQINLVTASWVIGILAAVYVVAGGLKACAWADLLQGSALIVGGTIVAYLAMQALGNADPVAIGLSADMADSGAIERFRELNSHKMHMVLPADDLNIPWTALLVGLWIPNFYYWGLNQYITQRTLGSKSLAEGQKGIVFAAAMKLLIPFIIVIPGIIAFNLYGDDMRDEAEKANASILKEFDAERSDPAASGKAFTFSADFAKLHPDLAQQMLQHNTAVAAQEAPKVEPAEDTPVAKAAALAAANAELLVAVDVRNLTRAPSDQIVKSKELIGYQYDSAFALLIKRLVPPGLRGFMLAAILGAVLSSLAAMLNAASTIFTMDIYGQYVNRSASQFNLVFVGRICVAVFMVLGCLIAPELGNPRFGGIFKYIQEFQGFISPGVLAIFVFGLLVPRAPRACGAVGLLLTPSLYGGLMLLLPGLAFLDRMAIVFASILIVLAIITIVSPLKTPVVLPKTDKIKLERSTGALWGGIAVVIATLALYAVFF
jgi:SSS family solute:Na+ symporter